MNEPQITLTGNVAAAPTLRMAAGTTPVTSFRIGATPRRVDKTSDTWSDGETLWFTVTAWRALAEHCVSSLVKGDKVVVTGRLTQRTWTADDGTSRAGLEVDAASVGLDLSRSSAVATRRSPAKPDAGSDGAPAETRHDAAPWGASFGADPHETGACPDEPGADDGGPWGSTGRTDPETGEVALERLAPALAQDEPESVGV